VRVSARGKTFVEVATVCDASKGYANFDVRVNSMRLKDLEAFQNSKYAGISIVLVEGACAGRSIQWFCVLIWHWSKSCDSV
jgi:hypothetical protein